MRPDGPDGPEARDIEAGRKPEAREAVLVWGGGCAPPEFRFRSLPGAMRQAAACAGGTCHETLDGQHESELEPKSESKPVSLVTLSENFEGVTPVVLVFPGTGEVTQVNEVGHSPRGRSFAATAWIPVGGDADTVGVTAADVDNVKDESESEGQTDSHANGGQGTHDKSTGGLLLGWLAACGGVRSAQPSSSSSSSSYLSSSSPSVSRKGGGVPPPFLAERCDDVYLGQLWQLPSRGVLRQKSEDEART